MSSPVKHKAPACFQMEFNRERVQDFAQTQIDYKLYSGFQALWRIAKLTMDDTMSRGGTFVLVVGPKTVTLVQRPDVEEFEP